MAYTGIDKEIYDSGVHFRPLQEYTQQQWTAPEIMGQNTNAGITATEVANPYKWPWPIPTGDGGAGDVSGTQQRSWNPNQNLGPTNITDYEAEADDTGSTWRGSVARLQDLYSKLPTPTNLLMKGIRRWRENRDIKRAEEQQTIMDKVSQQSQANAAAAAAGGGGEPQSGITASTTAAQAAGMGGGSRQATSAGSTDSGRTDSGWGWAQGGRIGYRNGEFVDEDINVEGPGFDVNENLMASDPNAMDSLNEMSMHLFGKGVHELSEEEYQMLIDMASDQASAGQAEGLASLV
jgi:hypothetical protein